MAAPIHERLPIAPALGWLDGLADVLRKELAPSRRRLVNTMRLATIGTVGAGIMAACHVDTPLGPYLVWLLVGAQPMLSLSRAVVYLLVEGPLLALSVPLAGMLSETPWLMLPFIFGFTAFSTWQIGFRKLGAFGLVLQVVVLDTFYGVMFAPDDFGWAVSAVFGASVIAYLLITAFDQVLWPDPAEALLLDSLATSTENNRAEFQKVVRFYLDDGGDRPLELPVLSQMPTQLALLNSAAAEGLTPHRRAILLAAVSREERVYTEIAKLTVWARENLPRYGRNLFRNEIELIAETLAAALDELAREARANRIRTGPDSGPSRIAARAQAAFDALDTRIAELRPVLVRVASVLEVGNFSAFCDTLHAMARLIERPLDEPPAPTDPAAGQQSAPTRPPADPALLRYAGKVALCMVIGYTIGLLTQRSELSVILTTIVITALPTYGASARKLMLRLVGTIIGGVVTILTIMLVTPNFETLPAYLIAIFIVLYISAYGALGSGRIAYAGKSIGTTFLLVFAGLSPSADIYGPLWRVWGILLGAIVVTVVFFLLWPEYAGDSLIPRLLQALRDAIDLAPGGAAASSEVRIHELNHDLTQTLIDVLQVADDARMEGRRSLIDGDAVVNAAGTLRRIAHRLGMISTAQLTNPPPPLDEAIASARARVLVAILTQIGSWQAFFQSGAKLSSDAARALAVQQTRDEVLAPLEEYSSRLAADSYAAISSCSVEQRREILAELQSLRRLEFLMGELNHYLAQVPGVATGPMSSLALKPSTS